MTGHLPGRLVPPQAWRRGKRLRGARFYAATLGWEEPVSLTLHFVGGGKCDGSSLALPANWGSPHLGPLPEGEERAIGGHW